MAVTHRPNIIDVVRTTAVSVVRRVRVVCMVHYSSRCPENLSALYSTLQSLLGLTGSRM